MCLFKCKSLFTLGFLKVQNARYCYWGHFKISPLSLLFILTFFSYHHYKKEKKINKITNQCMVMGLRWSSGPSLMNSATFQDKKKNWFSTARWLRLGHWWLIKKIKRWNYLQNKTNVCRTSQCFSMTVFNHYESLRTSNRLQRSKNIKMHEEFQTNKKKNICSVPLCLNLFASLIHFLIKSTFIWINIPIIPINMTPNCKDSGVSVISLNLTTTNSILINAGVHYLAYMNYNSKHQLIINALMTFFFFNIAWCFNAEVCCLFTNLAVCVSTQIVAAGHVRYSSHRHDENNTLTLSRADVTLACCARGNF